MGNLRLQEIDLLGWFQSALRERLGVGWRVKLSVQPGGMADRVEEGAAPFERDAGGPSADATVEITAPDGHRAVLRVEVRSTATLGTVADAASLARGAAADGDEVVGMLVAPYLNPRVREACREQGVAYADPTGAWCLRTRRPSIDWETGGAPKNPAPERRGLTSLLGTSTARVLRALVGTAPPYTLTEVAAVARVTPATVYKVVKVLEGEGLVNRAPRGPIDDVDWQGLLQRWAQEYRFERQNFVTPCLAARGPEAVLAMLREQVGAGAVVGARWALTGTSALRGVLDEPVDGRLVIYAEQPTRLRELLDLRPWRGPGSNAAVVGTRDPQLFEESVERDGLWCAPWGQVAVDLLGGRDRDPSAGENLLAWMSVRESSWRRCPRGGRDAR